MRSVRSVVSLAAVLAPAFSVVHVAPQEAAAQSSEITVLVAPLVVADGVHKDFGKDVAKKVRQALEGFGGLTPIDDGDVKDFLKQYGLKADDLSQIEWRQMAGRMSASMVMLGSAETNGGGIEIKVSFLDPTTGDELPVDPFTVADRKQTEEAAGHITSGLGVQVEYLQSLVFCSEYLASEQVEDALRNCNRALDINPESGRGFYLRGRTYMLQEAWGTAVEDLERVVAAERSNTDALQSLAYTHAQLGNAAESGRYYREYLNFNPDDAAVRLRVAFDLATAGGFAEAMAILDDGVARDPDNIDLLAYLGNVALSAGQSDGEVTDEAAIRKSVDAFEKVLAARGNDVDPTMLTNVVNANMLIEDYDAALAFSERAIAMIEQPPASASSDEGEDGPEEGPRATKEEMLASVYSARASVFNRIEQYAEAASALEEALGYDDDLPNGYQRLALFKLKAGDSDGAIADFRVAVDRGANPDDMANALFSEGYNDHFQSGRYLQAVGLFEVAAEFAQAPDVATQIQFFIAYGHYRRGTVIDEGNEQAEACGPARSALSAFRSVGSHLGQAGSYNASNQAEIREAVDVQLYRQEQIIQQACG